MNVQKEKEIKDLTSHLLKLQAHVAKNKKDHGAKITIMKILNKIRTLKKYIIRKSKNITQNIQDLTSDESTVVIQEEIKEKGE